MTILGMVAILWLYCFEDFDHFGEDDLPMDSDRPRDSGDLRDVYHPTGWLLNFGSIES